MINDSGVTSVQVVRHDVEKASRDKKDEEEYGEPRRPLDRFDVCRLLDEGRLQLPLEVEIDNKSKSDWFAKSSHLYSSKLFGLSFTAFMHASSRVQ
ncbi:hypothetical protein FRB91_006206 [Serendipita sp. 411]|nr:hypothetical protein FRB91_006206 [Serendipita sp. 411]